MPEERIYAFLKSFGKGINSYVDPLLLPPDQLAFATNATMRGSFVGQRPNLFNLTLNDMTAGAFQTGLFQGACYYRNATNGYIMVALNGNLFQISINPSSSVATITQAPASQKSTTAVKNAMWQAEQFLIWSDAQVLPTFFDGASSRQSLGPTPTPLGSTAANFNIPEPNQYVIGSAPLPAGNVPINSAWTAGQVVVLIGSALYRVAGWSGGGGTPGSNTTLGLAALTPASGLAIPVGTEAYTNTKYCGAILDAYQNDGSTTQTVFPPEPVAPTPGDSVVLTVLTPPTTASNAVPVSSAVASSRYYAGTIVAATVSGGAVSNYPTNTPPSVTIGTWGPGGWGTGVIGKNLYIYQNIGNVNSIYAIFQITSANNIGNIIVGNLDYLGNGAVAGGSTAIGASGVGQPPYCDLNGYTNNYFGSLKSLSVSTWPQPGIPKVVLTLSQNFAGSNGDILQDANGNLMTVVSSSGAQVTCTMNSNAMAAIPIGTLIVDNAYSGGQTTPLVTYGAVITGGGASVPAAGSNLTLIISPTVIPSPGQVVFFTTNLTGGGTQLVVAQVVSATGGSFGGATNYFQLRLSSPFMGNLGDVLNITTAASNVASFIVTQLNVGSQSQIQLQMNTSAAVGDVIPILAGNPATIANTVVDTSVGSGVLTGIGVIEAGGAGTTTNSGVVTINTPANFELADASNAANESQIIQVTIAGTVYPFWIVYVNGGISGSSSGAGPFSILLQNINDTPGLQNTGTAAIPANTSIQNFVPRGTFIYSLPEIPICKLGCYGQGRNWIALADGVSYVASDLVGSSTGSPQYGFTDAVLRVSQNYFMAGGGTFKISGAGEQIQAMQFVAQLDSGLGQGPLQIFTDDTVFSNMAPPDLTTWTNLASPIQVEGMIGSGAISQDAVVQQNNDLIFRLSNGGIQSMLMATLDFNQWGNTPISNEVARVIGGDNPALLPFASMTVFNNRMFVTAQPVQAARGVYWPALAVLNFDPLSSLAGKTATIWEGQWNGLNILKMVSGFFNGSLQCFAVCLSSDLTQIEIHQIQLDQAATLDNGSQPVAWSLESPSLFKEPESPRERRLYKRLINGEFSIQDISGNVTYAVLYRTDQNPNWTPWYNSTVVYQGASDPGYRRRIPIGTPSPTVFDPTNNQPMREGYNFQVMFRFTGACTLTSARFAADIVPEPEFGQPK